MGFLKVSRLELDQGEGRPSGQALALLPGEAPIPPLAWALGGHRLLLLEGPEEALLGVACPPKALLAGL